MELKIALLTLLVISLLVGDSTAIKWKFWKKDKDETTTTTASPIITDPQPTRTSTTPVNPARGNTPNTNKAIAGAADPGLVIGVGNTGGNIRSNAQPNRPNPGTQVGLDGPGPRPNRPGVGGSSGQGYRDWAADLTGAGEPGRQPPRVPDRGPALTTGGQQQPTPGSRPSTPTSVTPSSPQGQRPGQPISGQQQPTTPGTSPGTSTRPGPGQQGQSTPGQPTVTPGPQGGQSSGKPQVSTLNIGSISPGSRPGSPASSTGSAGQSRPGSPGSPTGNAGQSRPGSPGSPTGNAGQSRPGSPGSPTGNTAPNRPGSPGGASWASIAAGGSRPGSPTPSQGGGVQPGQTTPGQTRPGQQVPVQPYGQPGHAGSQQPGRTGPSTGSAVPTGAAAGAVAGTSANTVYSKNPTYSKGNTVTDEDLRKLSESLFMKDVNNANQYITLNLQKQTTSSSPVDEAAQPLLTVKPEALQIPTIQKVLAMYDNYELDTRTNEYVSPAERQEESVLVDTFLSTNVMSAAMRFLADKGFIRKDYYDYKDTLRRIWFTQYSRGDGKIGSSGFEHVFLTELKLGTEVSGLHSWIYFNAEEVKRKADYLGYIKKVDLGNKAAVMKVHLKFNGIDKPVTTIFIGTSPELEMALYTVCFFTRRDKDCPVSLGGTQFTINVFNFRYRGKDLIGSAFPKI